MGGLEGRSKPKGVGGQGLGLRWGDVVRLWGRGRGRGMEAEGRRRREAEDGGERRVVMRAREMVVMREAIYCSPSFSMLSSRSEALVVKYLVIEKGGRWLITHSPKLAHALEEILFLGFSSSADISHSLAWPFPTFSTGRMQGCY